MRHHIGKKKPRPRYSDKDIHKSLAKRLRIVGFILLALAFLFFSYALNHSPIAKPVYSIGISELSAGLPDVDSFTEASACETLNFYGVSFVFFSLGVACLLTSWKAKSKDQSK